MGYMTRYKLEWEPRKEAVSIFLEANEETFYGINSDGSSAEEVKWYDHDKDIIALSKQFKDVLFTLSGEGEEAEDIWKKYFQNGKKNNCAKQ